MYLHCRLILARHPQCQDLVKGLDSEKLKQEYGVLGASLNAPKLWLPDWSKFTIMPDAHFNVYDKTGLGC